MFEWLRRALWRPGEPERLRFFQTIDTLNADAHGGQPISTNQLLGNLRLRSGTLVFADAGAAPALELPSIVANEAAISASLWEYPSGAATVTALKLSFGEPTALAPPRKIGEVPIDSAKLVIADKADLEEHWTETGKDRIGVISTAPDDTVLHELTKRFHLKTARVSPLRAEVIGPVSESLEKDIEDYLSSNPKYMDFPFMHFYVQTNNSFDRANRMEGEWGFIPIGNEDIPLMFVCGTGRGDGCYDVECQFSGDVPSVVSIQFIEP